MDHGNMVSPEFMVLAHDIVDSIHHFMKGIPVTNETLALDLIDQVGPGGHYLTQKHTMDNFKKIKYSELFDRSIYAKWEESGSRKFEDRLQELTLKKMNHKPRLLSKEIIKELDTMQATWK
jgi:trimethylamine--corrinoid protein Co-methyltransferase